MDVHADGDIADNFWWRRTTSTRRGPLYDICVAAGLLLAATIVGALLDRPGLAPSIMIVYVFAVQLCAFFTWSRLYCLLSSAAAVALYFLNREAAKDVKVVLSGEGADELFGGYNIYRDPFTARWYDRLPPWLRAGLGAAAALLPPARGVNFLVRRGMSLEERYFGPTALFNEREKRRLLADYAGDGDPMFLTEAIWDATEGLDPVTRMQQVDLNLWLAGDILLKADKMSMAHSLELRVPFLDREVWALAAALPAAAKADARTTKIALRRAAARTLPAASAARKKLGFPVPVRDWLRQEPYTSRVRAVFSRPAAAEFFDPRALHSMLNQHLHGGDCWRQIWCVYSFLIWYEQFFGA